MPVHLVSAFATPDYGSEALRVGDLDGDGCPDLLFVQSDFGSRRIDCLTATTIAGQRLWQVGQPNAANGRTYSDLPATIYDWDDDGANEVLWVEQATYAEPDVFGDEHYCERAFRYEGNAILHILEGKTGRPKAGLALPAPADDSLVLADLTGRGRREDLVVKDRYWTMWGISHAGEVLWRWAGATGHYPAIGDIDNDGRDEVFVGYALIDHDGRVLFEHDPGDAHQDAAYVVQLADGSWRLLFGNHGVHCLDVEGRELWSHPLREAQHVVVGRYRSDTPLQVAVIDRGYPRTVEGNPADLYLYDLEDGREIWRRRQPQGGWVAACTDIRWLGGEGKREIMVYERGAGQPVAIYDGQGAVVDEMPVPGEICSTISANPGIHYGYRADVYGDSRDEVIVVGWKGVRVYANTRPLAIPTLHNATLYPGM